MLRDGIFAGLALQDRGDASHSLDHGQILGLRSTSTSASLSGRVFLPVPILSGWRTRHGKRFDRLLGAHYLYNGMMGS